LDFTHAALFVVKAHFVRQHVKADDGRGADAFPIGGKGGDVDAMTANAACAGHGRLPAHTDAGERGARLLIDAHEARIPLKHGEFRGELPRCGSEGFIEADDEAMLSAVFAEDPSDAHRRGGDAGVGWHALRLEPLLASLGLGLLFDLDDGDGRDGLWRHLMSEADHFGLVDLAGIEDDGMCLAGEVVGLARDHLVRAAEDGLKGGREEFLLEDELLGGR
jgi:hypothetical protein